MVVTAAKGAAWEEAETARMAVAAEEEARSAMAEVQAEVWGEVMARKAA